MYTTHTLQLLTTSQLITLCHRVSHANIFLVRFDAIIEDIYRVNTKFYAQHHTLQRKGAMLVCGFL